MVEVISFTEKLARFDELWSPRIVAQMNDYHFKLAKVEGAFEWHKHAETDEVFIVLAGALRIAFRDGEIRLVSGEMCVVPKGVEHLPSAEEECHLLLIEPAGTRNRGGERGSAGTWV